MAVMSKASWPVMALVMRSMSSGLISRYGKIDMKISFQLERENALSVSAQKRPRRAMGLPFDGYGLVQINMTCLCRFFS